MYHTSVSSVHREIVSLRNREKYRDNVENVDRVRQAIRPEIAKKVDPSRADKNSKPFELTAWNVLWEISVMKGIRNDGSVAE